jgi:hypothetical protein
MPRLMSVALTTPQVIARSKTVTRRDGWRYLKPGDHLTLCPKVMGFRRGEHPERIVDVEVLSVRRERLDAITASEVTAEGFPGQTPAWFIGFFCDTHKGCTPETEVTRIEWRYLDGPAAPGTPPARLAGRPETGPGAHPRAEGIERIRVSLHRPADGTGDILVVRDDGQEDTVGSASRTGGGPPAGRGWQADLWVAHPSLAEGHATWKRTAGELGDCLTESVRACGPWWELCPPWTATSGPPRLAPTSTAPRPKARGETCCALQGSFPPGSRTRTA